MATSGLYPGVDAVYRGHEGFRKFWRDFHEIWETLSMEMREVVAVGDRVAFSFHFDATGRDGVRAGRDQASIGTIRNSEAHGSGQATRASLGVGRRRVPGC